MLLGFLFQWVFYRDIRLNTILLFNFFLHKVNQFAKQQS